MDDLKRVVGHDGAADFECGLGTLVQWTGYSDQQLLNLAREGVIRRVGRGRYLLRASVVALLKRSRDRRPPELHDLSFPERLVTR